MITKKLFTILVIMILCIVLSLCNSERRKQRQEEIERRRQQRQNAKGACVSKDRKSCYQNITMEECKNIKEFEQKGIFRRRCPHKAIILNPDTQSNETTAQATGDV